MTPADTIRTALTWWRNAARLHASQEQGRAEDALAALDELEAELARKTEWLDQANIVLGKLANGDPAAIRLMREMIAVLPDFAAGSRVGATPEQTT